MSRNNNAASINSRTLTVRFDEKTLTELKQRATRSKVPVARLIRRWIELFILVDDRATELDIQPSDYIKMVIGHGPFKEVSDRLAKIDCQLEEIKQTLVEK